jgi:hypothetical protein
MRPKAKLGSNTVRICVMFQSFFIVKQVLVDGILELQDILFIIFKARIFYTPRSSLKLPGGEVSGASQNTGD